MLGEDETELPRGAVEPEPVAATPDLVAVAEGPVVDLAGGRSRAVEGGGLGPGTRHLLDIPGRRDLHTVDHTAGVQHDGRAGEIVHGQVKARGAVLDAAVR